MKKALFIDIDGTLSTMIDGKEYIPQSALEAILKARDNGHLLFISSGRPYSGLKHYEEYGFEGIIASVGAYIRYKDQVLVDKSLTKEQVKRILDAINEAGFDHFAETSEYNYASKGYTNIYDSFVSYPIEEMECEGVKKICFACDPSVYQDFIRPLQDDFYITEESYESIYFGGEISMKGINKGQAILDICDKLEIDIKDTYAFGDSHNDIEMLQTVGHPCIMGNSREGMDQYAEFKTKDLTEDGLAYAFKHYGLID